MQYWISGEHNNFIVTLLSWKPLGRKGQADRQRSQFVTGCQQMKFLTFLNFFFPYEMKTKKYLSFFLQLHFVSQMTEKY